MQLLRPGCQRQWARVLAASSGWTAVADVSASVRVTFIIRMRINVNMMFRVQCFRHRVRTWMRLKVSSGSGRGVEVNYMYGMCGYNICMITCPLLRCPNYYQQTHCSVFLQISPVSPGSLVALCFHILTTRQVWNKQPNGKDQLIQMGCQSLTTNRNVNESLLDRIDYWNSSNKAVVVE